MFKLYNDEIPCLEDLDLNNKRVLCRVDFNVPLDTSGKITDSHRIESSLETIQYCLDKGAFVTLISHLGRPKGKAQKKIFIVPCSGIFVP